MSKGVQIAGGATVIALLLGWYTFSQIESGVAFTYYQSLTEFQAAAAERDTGESRVHGYVALGTIERDVAGRQVHFAIQNDPPHAGGAADALLPVTFGSLETPDLFKDGAEVVLEGRLVAGDGGARFHADKVFAKCPSKFEGAEPTRAALN